MSNNETRLLELADACENARDADMLGVLKDCGDAIWPDNLNPDDNTQLREFERFLCANAFLEAAVMLVPAGCGWLAGFGRTRPDGPVGGAQITASAYDFTRSGDVIAEAESPLPAGSLAAAAMRARASS